MKKYLRSNFDKFATKRISFILPTRNRADYLDKSLKEISKLKGKNDELIIVDGLSTDHTFKVVQKYKQIVDVFISEPDTMVAQAFNKGILAARGKYIKNLADDDTIYKNALEKAIKILENNNEIDVLVCGGTKQYGEKLKVVYIPPGVEYGNNPENIIKYGACGIGFVIRRSTFAKAGLIPTIAAADPAFILECLRNKVNVKFCRLNLYNHPILKHSYVIKRSDEMFKDRHDLIKKYCSRKFYYQTLFKDTLFKFRVGYHFFWHQLFNRFSILKTIFKPLILIKRNIFQSKTSKTEILSKINSVKYHWDGGLS